MSKGTLGMNYACTNVCRSLCVLYIVFNQSVLVYILTVLAELKEKAVDVFDLDDHIVMKHLSTETQLPEGFDVVTKYVPLPCAFVSISLN